MLRADGCDLRIARRAGPQARVTTLAEPGGERTILLHGANEHPAIADPLDWDELAGFDGVFYTGDDPRTVVAARRARVLVATARRLASVVASRVQVDVLAGSARDRGERYDLADLPVRPRLCVWTEGADGGHYLAEDGSEGRWEAAARRGRSSTPTAPATSSWRRSRSSWRAGAGATRRSRWPRAPRPRSSRAAEAGRADPPPLRARAVLRAPLRLLRLRDRDGACRSARALRRRRAGGAGQERERLAPALETVFLGGGTPTLLGAALLDRLLGGLPAAPELTVEANPRPSTTSSPAMLAGRGVRVSLGAQSFGPRSSRCWSGARRPSSVRAAAARLRAAGVGQPLARPALRRAGHGARRARPRPRRGARAGARAPLLLRARGQAGHALRAPPRRRAGAPGRAAGGSLRARDRPPAGGRLPLVRDRQLLPRRPPCAAQPRLLDGPRLPRHRHRRRLDARARAAHQPALAGGVRRRARAAGRRRRARSSS